MLQAVVLNALGTAVWHLASGDRELDAIVDVIAERFPDVPRERIAADVAALIAQLAEQGLIEA